MSLRVQLLLLQVAIVLATVIVAGLVSSVVQQGALRDGYRDRMIAVAASVASMPVIVDAFSAAEPATIIQPIAEVIRKASNVTYVVVTDENGIRYSHPNLANIGKGVSTDPSIPLSGKMFIGTETGTLGESWRVKLPVYSADGSEIIGTASVGILESDLSTDLTADLTQLFLVLAAAAVLGVLGAAWVTRVIRRRIYLLEPEEIAALLETRDAMLHGIREGIVAIDDRRRIALINDEAMRLLDVDSVDSPVGLPIDEVFESSILSLLEKGIENGDTDQLVLSGQRILLARADTTAVRNGPAGTVLILRDHTALHQMLSDLEGAHGLADGLRAQAHEFSNKLHVISGLLELGRPHKAIEFIQREGSGGALSQVAGQSGILDIEVSALLIAKQAGGRERAVTVSVVVGSELRDLSGDDNRMLRADLLTILGNLIDNAVDACAYGGAVAVSIRDGVETVTVTVSDDGPGIAAIVRDRIFDSGVSTKASARGGRGIGLALVRRIALRYSGSATGIDRDAGGAIFTVVLDDLHRRGVAVARERGETP